MPRKGPRPCVCGHPKSWHTAGFGWCWLPSRPPGMVPRYCWCHGFREVRRTEPLRADPRESELARRLREQYGPLSAALSQPAPRLPLQEEEREMVRTVIRPALAAGYRLSSDDPEVQGIIEEVRLALGLPDEAVRRWVKNQAEMAHNLRRPEANVTGDQLLEEIDSLARARRRAGEERLLRAGPDLGDVPHTPDYWDQPAEDLMPPSKPPADEEPCPMRRWEAGKTTVRCSRAADHDGAHLFLPSPPLCGAPSRGSDYTCGLEEGHVGRHQVKFMTPATVSWSDEPAEPEPCRARYPWALTWSRDASARFCQLPRGHTGNHRVEDDSGILTWHNAGAPPSPINEVI